MKNKTTFSAADVHHIAQLANIPVTEAEEKKLETELGFIIDLVNQLQEVDTTGVEPTHQVTGQINVFREDEVDEERMLVQEEALRNAKNSHDGYFVVDAIFEEE